MRAVLFLILPLLLLSCSGTKQSTGYGESSKAEAKAESERAIRVAVETRKYAILLDRIYPMNGGYIDLRAKSNYFIVDDNIATVKLFYSGPSFGRPISAMNFTGNIVSYKLETIEDKGLYKVTARVKTGSDSFDFYITMGFSGSGSITVSNSYIQTVYYTGEVKPVPYAGTSDGRN